jgi:hypothetical protein
LVAVTDRFRRILISGTKYPLFETEVYRDEVIAKLALYRERLPAREELGSLQVQYEDTVVPFAQIAQRLGPRRSAMHAEDAVLMIAGPGVRHCDIGTAKLVDIAPTLLQSVGFLPPNDLQGHALDIFECESEQAMS